GPDTRTRRDGDEPGLYPGATGPSDRSHQQAADHSGLGRRCMALGAGQVAAQACHVEPVENYKGRAVKRQRRYKMMAGLSYLVCSKCLGKGEVESSILSCSTIFPLQIKRFRPVSVCSFRAARRVSDGTNRDCAPVGVQN